MQPLKDFKNKKIKVIFTDIDDTLTNDGRLESKAYDSLWRLQKAGLKIVPVTGRPAGWCEMIARQWPVDGIVGENGGLYFVYKNKKMRRHFNVDEKTQIANRKKLDAVAAEVLQTVKGCALASDQFCRMLDLAVDFCEDVPKLPDSDVQRIVDVFVKHGAEAKVSSIHVNGWFGKYDKLTMCETFAKNELNIDIKKQNEICMFVGDSPNDEPMWKFFKNSFGVANVKEFLPQIKNPPRFVASKNGGEGFAQIAKHVLSLHK